MVTLLLLRLQLKLPEKEPGDTAKQAVSLLVQLPDDGQLLDVLSRVSEHELQALLPAFDEEALQIQRTMLPLDAPCRGMVNKELARRLASCLESDERLKSLWSLLLENLEDDRHTWTKAAACVLVTHTARLDLDLQRLPADLLSEASIFLEDRDAAVAFAKEYGLSIAAAEKWPLKSAAQILGERARRLSEKESEEKLELLLKAHQIDETDGVIRTSLLEQLQQHILNRKVGEASAMEGLFLKLALELEDEIAEDVIPKLALEARHLSEPTPDHLMILVEQLSNKRRADGARVALFAARAFASEGRERDSEAAFLKAFALDHCNRDAAEGIVKVLTSGRYDHHEGKQRCAGLETKCQDMQRQHEDVEYKVQALEKSCMQLVARCQALQKHCEELDQKGQASQQQCQQLQEKCEGLQVRCEQLEKLQLHRLDIGKSLVWDLSNYDFTSFTPGQFQCSETFQLSSGIKAWLQFYPGGGGPLPSRSPTRMSAASQRRKAGVCLFVDWPCWVKWTCQCDLGEPVSLEHEFSESPEGAGWCPTVSQSVRSITLRILRVQVKGSSLWFS